MLKTPPATPKTSLDGTGAPLASEGQVLFPTPPRTPGANRTRKRSRLPSALVPALLDTEPDWRVLPPSVPEPIDAPPPPSAVPPHNRRVLPSGVPAKHCVGCFIVKGQREFTGGEWSGPQPRCRQCLAALLQSKTDPSWFHHPPLVTTTPLPAPIYQPQSRGCAECRGVLSKNEFDVAEWNNDYPRCRSCMTLFLMRGDEVPMVYEKETSEGGLGARATIRPFI